MPGSNDTHVELTTGERSNNRHKGKDGVEVGCKYRQLLCARQNH